MDKGFLEQEVIQRLRTCFDPEIPVDIYELGLIYEIKIDEESNVYVKMTLTSPMCPVAGSLPGDVKKKIKSIKDVNDVYIDLVWNPTWHMDMMSEAAKLELGFF
ncbi:MAG: iron-sulfur cluster assembly protein [Ignavibacteria bacterium]